MDRAVIVFDAAHRRRQKSKGDHCSKGVWWSTSTTLGVGFIPAGLRHQLDCHQHYDAFRPQNPLYDRRQPMQRYAEHSIPTYMAQLLGR